jgi:hypothetical protein
MDTGTVEELRRLRDGMRRTLVFLIASIAVVSAAALLAMPRRPEAGPQILILAGAVDLVSIAAAVTINARALRRLAQITGAMGDGGRPQGSQPERRPHPGASGTTRRGVGISTHPDPRASPAARILIVQFRSDRPRTPSPYAPVRAGT